MKEKSLTFSALKKQSNGEHIFALMSTAYKFLNPNGVYFVSFATVEWVDVFIRRSYHDIVLDSIKYCINDKGLVVHAWCLMPSHLHMIISRKGDIPLQDILRDMKKFTSNKLLKEIDHAEESRRRWMLWLFSSAGKKNSNNTNYQFWQQENHPEELFSNTFIEQKLRYIHNNPVEAGLVEYPEHYYLSSARDYVGKQGLLKVELLA